MVPFSFGLTANTSGYRRPSGTSPALRDHLQPHPCTLQQSSSPPRGLLPADQPWLCLLASFSTASVLRVPVAVMPPLRRSESQPCGTEGKPLLLQSLVPSLFMLCCHSCCSVTQSCPTLCDPMNCSTPGFPVLHYLPEFAQTHVHSISDAIQPSHRLSVPLPQP